MTQDKQERKAIPIATGFIDYFPDAVAEVAHLSHVANEQHNPGTPIHWDRAKSGDESDALMRHFMERGKIDDDGQRHTAKVAWRALALLQKEIEGEKATQSGFVPRTWKPAAVFNPATDILDGKAALEHSIRERDKLRTTGFVAMVEPDENYEAFHTADPGLPQL